MSNPSNKFLLLIGGLDPTGGAGLFLDFRIANALSCRANALVTALALQTDEQFLELQPLSDSDIFAQWECLDLRKIGAIKIGALGSLHFWPKMISKIKNLGVPVIVDPVLKTSSGGNLIEGSSLRKIREFFTREIPSFCSLLTPNYEEACFLLKIDKKNALPVDEIAQKLFEELKCNILLKGGHAPNPKEDFLMDFLVFKHKGEIISERFSHKKTKKNVRGTGCALATAISAHLLQSHDLDKACPKALSQLSPWIARAQEVKPGIFPLVPK